MQNWTRKFNQRRQALGREAITGHVITQVHEGMRSGCGCPMTNVTGKHITIQHQAGCTHGSAHKEVVGDGQRNAVSSLWQRPDVLPMTEPWLGLFPHEQAL